jgi:hypothetical protein
MKRLYARLPVHQWSRLVRASLRDGRSEGRFVGWSLRCLEAYIKAGVVTWDELVARLEEYQRECEE